MRHPRLIGALLLAAIAGLAFAVGYSNPKTWAITVLETGESTGADLDALMRHIALAHVHGDRDNAIPIPAAALMLAEGETLITQCGYIADAAAALLHGAGFQARRVSLVTGGELNGCDNGHQALEVFHPFYGQWVYVDFSTNRLYPQTVEAFTQGRADYVPLADDELFDPAWILPCDSPLSESVDSWYDRIAQIPIIEGYADADHPLAARAQAYGYTLAANWHERFYASEGIAP